MEPAWVEMEVDADTVMCKVQVLNLSIHPDENQCQQRMRGPSPAISGLCFLRKGMH